MGVGISSWKLAQTVSMAGQLGVVSGVGLDAVFIRLLESGDLGGNLKRALAHFPIKEVADSIFTKYFKPNDIGPKTLFRLPKAPTIIPSLKDIYLRIVATFCEVWLAKEKHSGIVGINLLEKLQLTNLATVYGAMLAGVDYILVGAGIPNRFPDIIQAFSEGREAQIKIDIESTQASNVTQTLSPQAVFGSQEISKLEKPKFLAIVSSLTLASFLEKKCQGRIDGYILESHLAGGHNAPPREKSQESYPTESRYGPKDQVDLEAFKKLSKPFWIAGSQCSPAGLEAAIKAGAQGIQVGSAFALCKESGLSQEFKSKIFATWKNSEGEQPHIKTDPQASPTGFPFKVAELPQTLADNEVYRNRTRICDVGILRRPYLKENGEFGYRCPAEPIEHYIKKGGDELNCLNRKCLCNALIANIGLGQHRKESATEAPLITLGSDLSFLNQLLTAQKNDYAAQDVINLILHGS